MQLGSIISALTLIHRSNLARGAQINQACFPHLDCCFFFVWSLQFFIFFLIVSFLILVSLYLNNVQHISLHVCYRYSTSPYSVLQRCGIRHPKPTPFIGNMMLFRHVSLPSLSYVLQKEVSMWQLSTASFLVIHIVKMPFVLMRHKTL